MNRHLTKEDTEMVRKHAKRYLTLYVVKESQIKTMRCHYVPIRMNGQKPKH